MYSIVNIKCNIHKHFTWKWLVIHSHFHKSSVKIWVECLEMKEAVKSLECRHHFLLRCELCRPECQCHHSSAISLFFPLFLGYFLVIPRVIFPLICVRSWLVERLGRAQPSERLCLNSHGIDLLHQEGETHCMHCYTASSSSQRSTYIDMIDGSMP